MNSAYTGNREAVPAAPVGASYRDPSGFVFRVNGKLYRQVNKVYGRHYRALTDSGLYNEFVQDGLLIPHAEVGLELAQSDDAFAILEPEVIPTISYPYEWSFSSLKDAALLTLDLAKRALSRGLILKDASAYNVQFLEKGSSEKGPIFIDTLSFEIYEEGKPWIAYGQFCRHFLAPLALMSQMDVRLGSLLATYRDGIPLDLASHLLPRKTWLRPGLLAHIHGHAKAGEKAGHEASGSENSIRVSKTSLLGLLDSLADTVRHLHWEPKGTVWSDYYSGTNYTGEAMHAKHELVREMLIASQARSCWDLGANDGEFSQIAVELGMRTVGWDGDAAAVEKAYARYRAGTGALPLLLDLTNPSPPSGWANSEQDSFVERGPVDLVMALALIHHLAIGANVPLDRVAKFFAELGDYAIVEFVPKEDSQVKRLLRSREDVFDDYSQAGFEAAFGKFFDIEGKSVVPGTQRTLYGMKRLG